MSCMMDLALAMGCSSGINVPRIILLLFRRSLIGLPVAGFSVQQ